MTTQLQSNSFRRFALLLALILQSHGFFVSRWQTSSSASRVASDPYFRLYMSSSEPKPTNIDLSSSTSMKDVVSADNSSSNDNNNNNDDSEQTRAATGTVNERLIAELQAAEDQEKYGKRSSWGKKMGLDAFQSTKTDAERQAAIDEARNLNGVNPIVTGLGSIFALAVAYGLWLATSWLASWFALHAPADTDLYIVTRSTAIFRNVVMGLVSLASGFFGVTGLGIFLLTLRVAKGVITGELDPTPIVQNTNTKINPLEEEFEIGNAWDLMMNKKPTRKSRRNNK